MIFAMSTSSIFTCRRKHRGTLCESNHCTPSISYCLSLSLEGLRPLEGDETTGDRDVFAVYGNVSIRFETKFVSSGVDEAPVLLVDWTRHHSITRLWPTNIAGATVNNEQGLPSLHENLLYSLIVTLNLVDVKNGF